jgi:apolipoprotein N-acyltransferase
VLSFTTSTGQSVQLSPLVCYEDIIPALGKTATQLGAQVLINQTNDAWFGDTVAPYQHHMIASFRAIENRRYLLRSTNSGLTAVVDPTGRTLASLLPYTESVLPMEISLLTYQSTYTNLPIENILTLLAGLSTGVILLGSFGFFKKSL